ncbi:methyltransferase domain-containing protein [Streptomyces sp. NPDC050095]|uniref:class I SAM-dependent methyltransferase n=1 Tax=unclassified Streptomyces TaxID=2593676 RepID=UPI00342B97FF
MPEAADRVHWGPQPGIGPGDSILGPLHGRRVLEVGCGTGRFAAHLARDHHAVVDAIDLSPTQHQRAQTRYGDVAGVRYLLGDAVTHLHTADPYELVFSVESLAYVDPHRALPALRHNLPAGGRLVFSVLHTDLDERGPSSTLAPREQHIRLKNRPPAPVWMWVLTPLLWQDLLDEAGFTVDHHDLLTVPDADNPVTYQLIQARRRTDRPHATGRDSGASDGGA